MLLYDSNPMLEYILPEISIDPLVPGRNMTDTCRVESTPRRFYHPHTQSHSPPLTTLTTLSQR